MWYSIQTTVDYIFFSCGPTSHAAPVCCRAFPFIHPRLASRIAPFRHLGTTRPGRSGNPAFREGIEGTWNLPPHYIKVRSRVLGRKLSVPEKQQVR